jgi:PadR family transcriptional regulator, regulatory protein PadR
MRGEALKGHLDLLLLAAVADAPAHGYAIVQVLRQRSGGLLELPEGTIYPALHRLEADGRLAGSWDEDQGRRRRVYRLTAKGRRALVERRREWAAFSGAVLGVLKGTTS